MAKRDIEQDRARILKLLLNRFQGINSPAYVTRASICERYWSPGIDSEEWIPPGWESIPGFLKGLHIPALPGQYDNPIPNP